MWHVEMMVPESSLLVEHLEAHLGRLVYGWSKTPDGDGAQFDVGRFEAGVYPDVLSFATIGLSRFSLAGGPEGSPIHQELLVSVHGTYGERNIPALLQQVGGELIERERAVLRGEVLGPRGTLLPTTEMAAFYAAIPVYFDDRFGGVTLESGIRAVVSWLVPITSEEASWAASHGWQPFEQELISQDPDLFDPHRPGLRLDTEA